MNTEIELKYLVNDNNVSERITQLFQTEQLSVKHNSKALANCYFDTPDQSLREFDMGLRIRTVNGKHEQTIKTAGTTVGGLHQRPEYNVDVDKTFPDLSLFPEAIWLPGQNVKHTQEQLVPLFTTNFKRETWLVTGTDNSVIEVAFDQGDISTAGRSVDICEVELELVSGDRQALLALAQLLVSTLSLRPGIKSKAARGYALWLDTPVDEKLARYDVIPLQRSFTIEKSFVSGLNFGLVHLQSLLNAYVNKPSLALLSEAGEVLALLRHGFWVFADYLPENAKVIREELSYYLGLFHWVDSAVYIQELTDKTGNYRKKLELSEQLFSQLKLEKRSFPSTDDVIDLIYSARFNQLQLSLLTLLLSMDDENTEQSQAENQELLDFSAHVLSSSLRTAFRGEQTTSSLSADVYIAQKKWVVRCLLSGYWFGSLYDQDARLAYRSSWLDIRHGLSELQTLWLLHNQLETLAQAPEKLLSWQKGKLDNLLIALDASRLSTFNVAPYWEKP